LLANSILLIYLIVLQQFYEAAVRVENYSNQQISPLSLN
jgi:hypothetical protein